MSTEPGLAAIEAISNALKKKYDDPADAEWDQHPLAWIRSKPSARIGKIGRLITQGLLKEEGINTKANGYLLRTSNALIQVRFSTGWSGGGFKFEQLRNESYVAIFCLGITPKAAYAWAIPRNLIFDSKGNLILRDGLTRQHKGRKGLDTAWLDINIQSIPSWLKDCGGTVAQAVQRLQKIL